MIIGFTATRKGITSHQIGILKDILLFTCHEFHHGDAVGGDKQGHDLATALGFSVHIHPAKGERDRAFCKGAARTYAPMDPLGRNRVIVDLCHALVGCPEGPEVLRSGTWSTIRYAKKSGKLLWIVYPNGTFEKWQYMRRIDNG